MPKSLTVTLSDELLRLVQDRVASGAYADESAVLSEGLRALAARDTETEQWLRDEVAPTYDRVMQDHEPLVTASSRSALLEEVRAAGRAKARPGPSAARSQDFLYDEDGLPK